jgi:hypothetical protein
MAVFPQTALARLLHINCDIESEAPVAIQSLFCRVSHAHVTAVTDLEGTVTRLICPEYQASTGACRLRTGALGSGPLSQLLERLDEDALGQKSTRCELFLALTH